MSNRVDTKKWAEFYGVTQRSVQNWVNSLRPVEHPLAMAKIILADARSSARARAKAIAILGGEQQSSSASPSSEPKPPLAPTSAEDPAWKEFIESGTDAIETVDTLVGLKKLRAFNVKKLESATATNDTGGISIYTRQVIELENAINRNLLMAKKLGIDAGELIKRETVEHFLETLGFLLMRGADDGINHLAKSCVGKTYPEEIRPLLEDYFLSTRFLRPFRSIVSGQRSGLTLPAWFTEKLIAVAESQIEGARADLSAQPMPHAPSVAVPA